MTRAVLLALLLGALPPPAAAQTLEYDVKAAFLFNFARFVTWPPDAFPDAESPIAICVLGPDPFGPRLDEIVAGERIEQRPLLVRRLARPDAAAGCHVLFVSPSDRERFRTILTHVNTRRVLTVSDAIEFLDAGGHFSFYLEANRVRFAANTAALGGCDFQVSSKLLQVARIHTTPAAEPAP